MDNKRLPAVLCLLFLLLFGCSRSQTPAPPAASSGAASSASGPADASTPAPKPDSKPSKPAPDADPELTIGEARALLAEHIDTQTYMILEGDAHLKVDGKEYFLFIVADKATNKAIGQVAVDKTTGARYNYEGEGVLGDYSDFALYSVDNDRECDWNGEFTDGERTLLLMQGDPSSFEYELGDTAGVARISGTTAADGELTFTYGEDGTITLSGSDEGVFTLVS